MENIKFKAKRLDNGEWIKGYFYEENDNTYIIENRQEESKLNRNITYQADPSTVCLFTGFLDKSGREIYEGDIVKYPTDTPSINKSFQVDVIEWTTRENPVCVGFWIGSDYADQESIEVIGNIHENPDLLK